MPAGAPSGGDWGVGSAGSGAAKMLYRPIPHTGQQVSVVSLGVGSLHESSDAEITRIVDTALGSGMNLVDMIMPTAGPMEAIARGMKPHRQDTIAQFHLGATYNMAGVTDRTCDLDYVRTAVASARKHFEANGGTPSDLKLFSGCISAPAMRY